MKRSMVFVLILCVFLLQPQLSPATDADDRGNPAFGYVAEGRGCWGPGGRRGGNIDSTMKALADAGINMIYPNISSGGRASYPSSVLPMRGDTDRLAQLVEAAHKYGIEIHAWRINWYMGGASDEWTEEMIRQGRIQCRVIPVQAQATIGVNYLADSSCHDPAMDPFARGASLDINQVTPQGIQVEVPAGFFPSHLPGQPGMDQPAEC